MFLAQHFCGRTAWHFVAKRIIYIHIYTYIYILHKTCIRAKGVLQPVELNKIFCIIDDGEMTASHVTARMVKWIYYTSFGSVIICTNTRGVKLFLAKVNGARTARHLAGK